DGHSSHITANMNPFCIDKDIYILILSAHPLRLLQLLDIRICCKGYCTFGRTPHTCYCRANNLLSAILRKKIALLSLARRYIERILNRSEIDRIESIILCKRPLGTKAHLKTRNEPKNGKRVILKDRFVFNIT
ncbi:hypothetical protein M433DRAFT_77895, partial [Acidomyces richmondensis BFW]